MGKSKVTRTLLVKQADFICKLSLFVYSTLLAIFWKQNELPYSSKYCREGVLPEWIQAHQMICIGASSGVLIIYMFRFLLVKLSGPICEEDKHFAYFLMFIIALIATSSHVLQFLQIFDNCVDILGIKSFLVQWAEWQVSVPLMLYMNITLDKQKQALSGTDWAILLCAGFTISLAFSSNLGLGNELSLLFIFGSCLCLFLCLTLNLNEAWKQLTIHSNSVGSINYAIRNIASQKLVCSIYLVLAFPLFPLIYFAAVYDVISKDSAVVLTTYTSILVKLMFLNCVIGYHVEMLDPKMFDLALERLSSDSRRAFLRYVFHEVHDIYYYYFIFMKR